jgi:CPA2 family monovalent cation:H+ antiporter-2
LRMLGYSSGGILDRKEHGPNPRIMQIMADQLLAAMHTAALLLELGGVLLGLGISGQLARRLGLSPIPLYLLAGLAFGQGGLLPLVTTQDFIQIGAEIGVILLLLLLGLEYSAAELLSSLRASAPAGLVDLALNFTPGLAAGLLLGWGPLAAIALGGITYISSSGVIAKLLGDLGRLANRETPVVLSILVIEDLAMAAYLPVVTVLLTGGGPAGSLLPATLALAAVAAVLAATLRYGAALNRLVFSPSDEVLLLKILGITFLVAGVAHGLQVSAAVGAFLVGIALSGPAAAGARALLTPLRDLFAAVFFVFFGLQTDPRTIPPVALVAIVLALVTVLTKLATGWWAARRAGIGTLGRFRAGAALVARGEFSIVIAGLAVAAGLDPALGPLAATYVLILAALGPILARIVDPLVKGALRLRPGRPPRPPPKGSETPADNQQPGATPIDEAEDARSPPTSP